MSGRANHFPRGRKFSFSLSNDLYNNSSSNKNEDKKNENEEDEKKGYEKD